MDAPPVRAMTEGLLALLERKSVGDGTAQAVPDRKWTELQRENDRLKVEVDLLKMALEDARSARE